MPVRPRATTAASAAPAPKARTQAGLAPVPVLDAEVQSASTQAAAARDDGWETF
jgi:hypothetical protein